MLVCFDLDDTLLDHSGAEKAAALHFGEVFRERLSEFGEAFTGVWQAAAEKHMEVFLRGEISFQEQRRRRMRELFVREPEW